MDSGNEHHTDSGCLSDAELRRLEWASRRGMLELDLLLEKFAKTTLKELSGEHQRAYKQLMGSEDQDLYRWLMGHASPDAEELLPIIDIIQKDLKDQW